jgi:hypothetical protein
MSSALETTIPLNPRSARRSSTPRARCWSWPAPAAARPACSRAHRASARARRQAPEHILAFTFTNRAAREMRERVERIAGEAAAGLWMGTFHGTALRILRRDGLALGIAPAS